MKTSLDWFLLFLINQIHRFGLLLDFCLSILLREAWCKIFFSAPRYRLSECSWYTRCSSMIFFSCSVHPLIAHCLIHYYSAVHQATGYQGADCSSVKPRMHANVVQGTIQNIFPTCEITTSVR